MIHKGCPQSNSSQTDVIYQLLSKEATLQDREEAREGKGEKTRNKGMIKKAFEKQQAA